MPRKAAPQIIEEANRRSRVFWIFKVYILQRPPRKAGLPPNKFVPGISVEPGYGGVTGVSNCRSTNISFRQGCGSRPVAFWSQIGRRGGVARTIRPQKPQLRQAPVS